MPNKQPGTLPLPRPGKYLRQLFDALRGRNTEQIKYGEGVVLPDMRVALIRDSEHAPVYHVVFGDGEQLYKVGTLPAHAVKHFDMQRLGSVKLDHGRDNRARFDGSATAEDMRRMGYNPVGGWPTIPSSFNRKIEVI